MAEMWNSVSDTAEYGGLAVGPEIVDEGVRENMDEALERVQNGEFAREWILENQAGRPSYTQLHAADRNHDIEEVGARLRALFSWADEEAPEEAEAPADD
jgi:ketol-acid reductoisomerase